MIGLIIWNLILTIMFLGLGLMFLGARVRDERDKAALAHDVNTEFDAVGKRINIVDERLNTFLEAQKTYLSQVKTLEGVSEQIENLQTGLANLQETQKSLRQDVDVLLRADKEYSVLTAPLAAEPVKASRGGRPRKGEA